MPSQQQQSSDNADISASVLHKEHRASLAKAERLRNNNNNKKEQNRRPSQKRLETEKRPSVYNLISTTDSYSTLRIELTGPIN